MQKGSISGSLDRIEAALERIEAVARAQPASPSLPVPFDDDLERRHQALKGAVEGALERIDGLIAEQTR